MSTNSNQISKKTIIGWIVTIASLILVLSTSGHPIYTNEKQVVFLAITIFFILLTALELVDNFVIGLLLPFSYLFFGVAPAKDVFSAWYGNIPWVVLAGFVIANVLNRSNLLKRIVYSIMYKTGAGYKGIIWGFAFAGIILELMTACKSFALVAALAFAVVTSLNLPKSKTAAGIFLAAAWSSMGPAWFLFNITGVGLLVTNMSTVSPLPALDYATFFFHQLPYVLLYFAVFLIIPIMFKQDVQFDGKDVIKQQLDEMGKMTLEEKKGAIVSVIGIGLLLTTALHGINFMYVFVFWAVSFFLPGINIGKQEDIKNVNLTFLFFTASFVSIGSCAAAVGFGDIISTAVTPLLGQADGSVMMYGGVFVMGFIMDLVMTPLAGIAGFSVPLAQIALDLNMALLPTAYTFLVGLTELILPYEISKYLLFYAYGYFTLTDFMKLFGLKAILALVFTLAVMLPWWSLIGLM